MSDPRATVLGWLDASNARDTVRLLALAHCDVVVRPLRWGARAEYRGHDGLREWIATIAAPECPSLRADELQLLGPGRVLLEGRIDGVDDRFIALFEVRDGRVVSVRAYISDHELLEQLGRLQPGEPAAARTPTG